MRAFMTLAIAVMTFTSGCSLLFVRRPPERVGGEPLTCTSSRVAPAIDTVFTLIYAAGTAAVIISGDDNTRDMVDGWAVGVAATALFGASAISGYTRTAACAELIEAQEERRRLESETSRQTITEPTTVIPQASAPPPPATSQRPTTSPPATPSDQRPVLLFEGPPSQSAPPPTPPESVPTQPAP